MERLAMQAVTLCLYRFGALRARLWAFAQMGLARGALGRVRDIGTFKLCGSGTGEGFTPIPDTAVCGILATWPDHDAARRALFGARVFRRYREMADERLTIHLTPTRARGRWGGIEPFAPQPGAETGGPVAALTRATVRPAAAARFWRREPAISAAIGADENVIFKIGIGELPLIRQVTFSIWPDAASMARFAREGGPHARAIKAARDGRWFGEELYARFRVDAIEGAWNGRTPRLPTPRASMKAAAE